MCSTTIIEFPTPLSVRSVLQKPLFHGLAHVRAAAPSGPLSYCFGIMATSGEPSTWLPLGELEGQEPSCYHFPENLKFSKKYHHFSTF